jgi:hypothetical protein
LNKYSDQKTFSRRQFAELLRVADLDRILAEARQWPPGRLITPLFSALCSADESVKWRAVAVMGRAVARLADEDMEAARVVMRRFMWSLNDESGGIGWGIPEAMGEVLAGHDRLAEEYAHILVSFLRKDGFYLEYEPLQRGLMWGLGRLAQIKPQLLRAREAHSRLRPYLLSVDGQVRGLAARALGLLKDASSAPQFERLLADSTPVRLHEDGAMKETTVGELARQALAFLHQ